MANAKVNQFNSFDYPWRIEGKATAFSRYMIVGYAKTLTEAIANADTIRKQHHYYATRPRSNACPMAWPKVPK